MRISMYKCFSMKKKFRLFLNAIGCRVMKERERQRPPFERKIYLYFAYNWRIIKWLDYLFTWTYGSEMEKSCYPNLGRYLEVVKFVCLFFFFIVTQQCDCIIFNSKHKQSKTITNSEKCNSSNIVTDISACMLLDPHWIVLKRSKRGATMGYLLSPLIPERDTSDCATTLDVAHSA